MDTRVRARSRAAAAEFTGAFLKSVHWEFQEGGTRAKGDPFCIAP